MEGATDWPTPADGRIAAAAAASAPPVSVALACSTTVPEGESDLVTIVPLSFRTMVPLGESFTIMVPEGESFTIMVPDGESFDTIVPLSESALSKIWPSSGRRVAPFVFGPCVCR